VDADMFNGIVSMLCFLHIPDRAKLFDNCARALVGGGVLFTDDYYERAPLTDTEKDDLAEKVYCHYVPTRDRYVDDLREAGFIEVTAVDKTADWTDFVNDRLEQFHTLRADLGHRYGTETVANLDDFYTTVAGLFNNGHLGGLRLTARLGS